MMHLLLFEMIESPIKKFLWEILSKIGFDGIFMFVEGEIC